MSEQSSAKQKIVRLSVQDLEKTDFGEPEQGAQNDCSYGKFVDCWLNYFEI